ncbi:hypothetical protein N7457_005565 [Penicillium paradoxum]|uniref:uncharacterized protein n=1 Tax=Penicillium paradoxum TaxID=176176 RepID=UPI002547680D|nr:uncharacterized protein N7457_005565 [Penicillium paradoxum]KAJ5780405.1 hypothetical protein N7457_005565 [Penicillium paradoxum]
MSNAEKRPKRPHNASTAQKPYSAAKVTEQKKHRSRRSALVADPELTHLHSVADTSHFRSQPLHGILVCTCTVGGQSAENDDKEG